MVRTGTQNPGEMLGPEALLPCFWESNAECFLRDTDFFKLSKKIVESPIIIRPNDLPTLIVIK